MVRVPDDTPIGMHEVTVEVRLNNDSATGTAPILANKNIYALAADPAHPGQVLAGENGAGAQNRAQVKDWRWQWINADAFHAHLSFVAHLIPLCFFVLFVASW